MKTKMTVIAILMVFAIITGAIAQTQNSVEETAALDQANVATTEVAEATEATVENADAKDNSAIKYIAAAVAVGIACLAGGMAVGKIGAAAMGAMSENSELSGKALPFVGLAEGICLWGFLVALLIIIL